MAASDYSDDLRIGPEILKTFVETYKKLRNTLRWMLGALGAYEGPPARGEVDELERHMRHKLVEVDREVRAAYREFDYKRVVSRLSLFLNMDLSAFYFDIRKDALYCDPISSRRRRDALETIEQIFRCVTLWLAPILVFTAEEAWLSRYPEATSVHLEPFPELPSDWGAPETVERWAAIRAVRAVVTGALEIARAEKTIGASLEAAPVVYVADPSTRDLLASVDFADVCITSDIAIEVGDGPADAFRLPGVAGVAVAVRRAAGTKCARSWRFSPLVGSDAEFPDVTPRDAEALRELKLAGRLA